MRKKKGKLRVITLAMMKKEVRKDDKKKDGQTFRNFRNK